MTGSEGGRAEARLTMMRLVCVRGATSGWLSVPNFVATVGWATMNDLNAGDDPDYRNGVMDAILDVGDWVFATGADRLWADRGAGLAAHCRRLVLDAELETPERMP